VTLKRKILLSKNLNCFTDTLKNVSPLELL
jgi:hypothetical protein